MSTEPPPPCFTPKKGMVFLPRFKWMPGAEWNGFKMISLFGMALEGFHSGKL